MYNNNKLRLLYPPGSTDEDTKRRRLRITLTPETSEKLEALVYVGRGGYGSAIIELSLRFLLALSGKLDLEKVMSEIKSVMTEEGYREFMEHLAAVYNQEW
jgi:hypothetical protein